MDIYKTLIDKAISAQSYSYAPYSNLHVGAAILFDNGEIVTGCNVENSSYSMTICAERCAMASAIAKGLKCPIAIAIVSDNEDICPPCGACRQFLSEFNSNIDIVLQKDGKYEVYTLSELLPLSFSFNS